MKAVFVKRENNVTTFTMEFTAEDFEEAIVQSYKANKGKYQIPGFRIHSDEVHIRNLLDTNQNIQHQIHPLFQRRSEASQTLPGLRM